MPKQTPTLKQSNVPLALFLSSRFRTTRRETRLLCAFFEAPVVTHEAIIDAYRSSSGPPQHAPLYKVRAKLRTAGAPAQPFIAVHGVGYTLAPEAREWLVQCIKDGDTELRAISDTFESLFAGSADD